MEIEIAKGIGPVELDMSRSEVHARMGAPLTGSGREVEYYAGNAFQVSYDDEDRVEFIEVARDPDLPVTLRGVPVLQIGADEAVRFVSALAPPDELDDEYPISCTFPSIGLTLWRECLPGDDPDGEAGRRFESVALFAERYLRRRSQS